MNLNTLTDSALHDLSARIAAEWERRRASQQTDQAVTEVITGLQDAGKITPPPAGTDTDTAQPWQDPGTDHTLMYRPGDTVTHHGKTWLSRHPYLNHWEPGTPGVDGRIWLDVTPPPIDEEDAPQPFVKPTGAHDAYSLGARVLFNGKVYRSLIDANIYSPDEYPSGWELEDLD